MLGEHSDMFDISGPAMKPIASRLRDQLVREGSGDPAACLGPTVQGHGYVVSGKTLFVSLFDNKERTAGVARIPLP